MSAGKSACATTGLDEVESPVLLAPTVGAWGYCAWRRRSASNSGARALLRRRELVFTRQTMIEPYHRNVPRTSIPYKSPQLLRYAVTGASAVAQPIQGDRVGTGYTGPNVDARAVPRGGLTRDVAGMWDQVYTPVGGSLAASAACA